MKYQYYIASRWRNKDAVRELVERLREKGKTVYSFLEGDGKEYELKKDEESHDPETFMQKYESIPDWQTDPRVREIFEIDMSGIRDAENFILLLPAGKSSHIEAGVAYGLGKHCIVIGEQKETESLYLIFNKLYNSSEEFIESLK